MRLDLQPTLRGTLVTLRPLVRADYASVFAAAADPLIWEQHPDRERYTEERFRVFFDGAIESCGAFAVIDNAADRIIGSSRYLAYDEALSEVEIGWTFLQRSYWGGQYNGEMKRLMLAHAFQSVERVVLLVGENNWRSRRAVEKIGGTLAGRATNSAGRDSVRYEISRAAFAASSLR